MARTWLALALLIAGCSVSGHVGRKPSSAEEVNFTAIGVGKTQVEAEKAAWQDARDKLDRMGFPDYVFVPRTSGPTSISSTPGGYAAEYPFVGKPKPCFECGCGAQTQPSR